MGFGKNPYVAKAQLAEQKAEAATDRAAREMAYRDAAHQWDRAADREKPGKLRAQYEEHAVRNRELADAHAKDDGQLNSAPTRPKLALVK